MHPTQSMQYVKVSTSATERMEEAPDSEPSVVSCCSSNPLLSAVACCGFAAQGSEPDLWVASVQEAWWYQASCFAYCVAGGLLLLRPEPLERHMLFPWRCMGISVFVNGFTSYMSDVETWGRPSVWKATDLLLATTNSLLQIGIVIVSFLSDATFPLESVGCLATGVLIALACKQRSATAMRNGHCDAYLRWHAAWHYSLPTFAIIGQAVLHRACDYSLEASCACPKS